MRNNTEEKNVSLIDEAESDKLKKKDDNSLVDLAAKILMDLPAEHRRKLLSKY